MQLVPGAAGQTYKQVKPTNTRPPSLPRPPLPRPPQAAPEQEGCGGEGAAGAGHQEGGQARVIGRLIPQRLRGRSRQETNDGPVLVLNSGVQSC